MTALQTFQKENKSFETYYKVYEIKHFFFPSDGISWPARGIGRFF